MHSNGSDSDQSLELKCRLALARAAGRAGNLNAAQSAALEALRLSQDDDANLTSRAEALNILGGVAFERGALGEAEFHYRQALRCASQCDNRDIAVRAGNNLACIRHLQGDAEGARRMYCDVLDANRQTRDRRGQAETLHNLAITYRMSGDAPAAAQLSAEARELALAIGDPSLLAFVMCGEAEGALDMGATDRAITLIEHAAEFARQANDPLRQSEVDRVRAACMARRGEIEVALTLLADASANAELHSARLLQADCAATAGRMLAECGRTTEAAARFAEADRLFLSIGVERRSDFAHS